VEQFSVACDRILAPNFGEKEQYLQKSFELANRAITISSMKRTVTPLIKAALLKKSQQSE
jgi:hypothetical protein